MQIYTGHLSDHYGRRLFVLSGLLVFGTAALLLAQAANFWQLLSFRLLQGIGLGIFGPAALGISAQYEKKGISFASYRVAQGAGIVVGPALGGVLGSAHLSYPFLASAILSFLAVPTVAALPGQREETERPRFLTTLKELLKTRGIIPICLATFMLEMGFASLDIVIPLSGAKMDLPTSEIGLILSSYFLTFVLFQIPLGFLSERISRSRLVTWSAFLTSLPFLWLYAAQGFLSMVAAASLLGITLGSVFVQSSAWIADLSPLERKSMYMGFFDSIIDYTFVLMPLLVGWIALYDIKAVHVLSSILAMVGGLTFLFAAGQCVKVPENLAQMSRPNK